MRKIFISIFSLTMFLTSNSYTKMKNIDFTYIKTEPLRKYIMDTAVTEKYVFVLCMFYRGKTDAIIKYNRHTGRRTGIFYIGKFRAAALVAARNSLWVLSRRRNAFIRRIDLSGRTLLTVNRNKSFGSLYGFAKNRDKFYFSSRGNGISIVYSFNIKTSSYNKIYSVPKTIKSLTFFKGKLYAYQSKKNKYSKNWLIITDVNTLKSKTMQFFALSVWGLSNDNNTLFLLHRTKGRAVVYSFYVKERENLILGRFRKKNVKVTYSAVNRNRNPYELRLWLPTPKGERYRSISNISVYPKPLNTIKDEFGNNWMYFKFFRSYSLRQITINYQILYPKIVYTLDTNYYLNPAHIPDRIKSLYLKPTYCFDYDNITVKNVFRKIKNKIKNYSLVDKIIAVRNLSNDIIIKDGRPSGKLVKASDIIKFRYGRCYYHTVLFAALLRIAGVPSRAIGGQNIYTNSPHTWNQVYFPKIGWIDIDSTYDDNERGGPHYINSIGNRRANTDYFLTFRGSYGRIDYKNVFTRRGWRKIYRWRSLNRRRRAKVKVRMHIISR